MIFHESGSISPMQGRASVMVGLRILMAAIALHQAAAGTTVGQTAKTTGDWTRATPSPIERVEAPTLVVKNQIYIFGGFDKGLRPIPFLDVYDPAKDSWTRFDKMPLVATHLNPATDGTSVWFAGGYKGPHPGKATAEVWRFDLASKTFHEMPSLPAPRAAGGLVYRDKTLHYFGGFADRNKTCGEHWTLSLPDGKEWQPAPELPKMRGHFSPIVLDGIIYALGGQLGHDANPQDMADCHRYDPKTKAWSACASIPFNRSHFEPGTFEHKGKIIIVGGRSNNTKQGNPGVAHITEYDPKTDQWKELPPLPVRLLAPAAAILDGKLIVIAGGMNNTQPVQSTTWIRKHP